VTAAGGCSDECTAGYLDDADWKERMCGVGRLVAGSSSPVAEKTRHYTTVVHRFRQTCSAFSSINTSDHTCQIYPIKATHTTHIYQYFA